jgi:hypothetical protein
MSISGSVKRRAFMVRLITRSLVLTSIVLASAAAFAASLAELTLRRR